MSSSWSSVASRSSWSSSRSSYTDTNNNHAYYSLNYYNHAKIPNLYVLRNPQSTNSPSRLTSNNSSRRVVSRLERLSAAARLSSFPSNRAVRNSPPAFAFAGNNPNRGFTPHPVVRRFPLPTTTSDAVTSSAMESRSAVLRLEEMAAGLSCSDERGSCRSESSHNSSVVSESSSFASNGRADRCYNPSYEDFFGINDQLEALKDMFNIKLKE
ncbi:hypothetical protein PIB30_007629 [Stylosanthes scabra]|uniref:Uncharacterized protein n=1 Tax=Stylosanthes scabra TaxID=79078 RepID=A0ABU6V3G3_9FABA|nr:hypothetical protein [Stylosanthes scabra]